MKKGQKVIKNYYIFAMNDAKNVAQSDVLFIELCLKNEMRHVIV